MSCKMKLRPESKPGHGGKRVVPSGLSSGCPEHIIGWDPGTAFQTQNLCDRLKPSQEWHGDEREASHQGKPAVPAVFCGPLSGLLGRFLWLPASAGFRAAAFLCWRGLRRRFVAFAFCRSLGCWFRCCLLGRGVQPAWLAFLPAGRAFFATGAGCGFVFAAVGFRRRALAFAGAAF